VRGPELLLLDDDGFNSFFEQEHGGSVATGPAAND